MKKKRIMRSISLVMLAAAAVFVVCALSNPTLGSTVYIGSLALGAEQWRIGYMAYILVMVSLFAGSFLVKER